MTETTFNADSAWEAILAVWPKKQSDLDYGRDKVTFIKCVKTQEDFEKLQNHLSVLTEDVPSFKLPFLSDVIIKLFRTPKKHVPIPVPLPSVVDKEALYQSNDDPQVVEAFSQIWTTWPRSPNIIERRKNALAAFLAKVKVLPLADLETACQAYANAFGDGGYMVFPKTLKNFLNDDEMVEEWLERATAAEKCQEEKKHFEVAYAWFPPFQGKELDRVKEASWVVYWRLIKYEQKLDFLSLVQLYRRQRKRETADMSSEAGVMYTKSFATFVSEWQSTFTRETEVAEAKAGIFAQHAIAYAKDMGLDLNNIWGCCPIPFFVNVLTYYCGTCANIREAIKQGLTKTVNSVQEIKKDPKKFSNIKDLQKAVRETEGIDVDSFANALYDKIFSVKAYEMPPVIKNIEPPV